MKHLDLFSGIGGFALGLQNAGFETVAYCEIDPWCQRVLKKHFGQDITIYDDVRNFNHDGSVDIITGGFPCQPFSVAGKQKGKEDDRHLWPAMFSIIKDKRPRWVIGENVPGLIKLGLDEVLFDLESAGYTCQTFNIPACAIGAGHRRERLWIVANFAGEPSNGTAFDQMDSRTIDSQLGNDFGARLFHAANSISRNRFVGSPEYHGAKTSEGLRICSQDPIYLNPSLAEVMMGFPEGWTDLED